MKDETKLIHLARGAREFEGAVNLPVHRASTIVSPDAASYLVRMDGKRRFQNVTYGATGTRNARALGDLVAQLEGGVASIVTASGLSAVTLAISALVAAGDHVLMTDSVYGPTRRFCDEVLTRYGVTTTYYDPCIDALSLAASLRENTRVLYMESPGSLTFEMQDVPALAELARGRGVLSVIDNTWATPLGFKPLTHAVDVSIQAGTKYLAGHSDLVIGMISTIDLDLYERIADHVMIFGDVASPDDCYLALRGLRTLAVRLRQQLDCAIKVAGWLCEQPQVARVLYPPLASDPGYQLYQRDFRAGASLFGLQLKTTDQDAAERFIDALQLFQIGSSWGGFESLVAINRAPLPRAVNPWTDSPFLLRLHIGLEDPADLIDDLSRALQAI